VKAANGSGGARDTRSGSRQVGRDENYPMRIFTVLVCALFLVSCGSDSKDTDTGSTIASSGGKMTLGVNQYLWHASLDTLRFMPLQSADPFGGVIITDWYSAPEQPNERLRVTVYILDRNLRADGLKVAVFRQTHASDGWVDALVSPDTATKLEDDILTRARELRLATQSPEG
jgi:hypothetical protein